MATAYQNAYGFNPRSNLYDKWISPTMQSPSYSITPLAKSPSLYTYSEVEPKSGDSKLSTSIISSFKREIAAVDKPLAGHIPAKYNSYVSGVITNTDLGKVDNIKTDSNADLYRLRKDRIDEELGHYGSNSYINESILKPNTKPVTSPSTILKNAIKSEHDLDARLGVDSHYAIHRDWRTIPMSPTKKQYLGSAYSDKARLPETELGVLPFERSHSTISPLRSTLPDQNAVAGRIREIGITSLGLNRSNTFHGISTNSETAVPSIRSLTQPDNVVSLAKTTQAYTQSDNRDSLTSVDNKKAFDSVDAILKRQQDITKATNLSAFDTRYKLTEPETTGIATTSHSAWRSNHDISSPKSYLTAYDKEPINYTAANRLDTADLARAKLLKSTSANTGSEYLNSDYLRSRDFKSSSWKLQDYMHQLDARENQRIDASKVDYAGNAFQRPNSNEYSSNNSALPEENYSKYRPYGVGNNWTSPDHKSSYSGTINRSLSASGRQDPDEDSGPTSNRRDDPFGSTTSYNTRNDVISCLTSTVTGGALDRVSRVDHISPGGALDRVSRVDHISPRYDIVQTSKANEFAKSTSRCAAPKSILKKTSAYEKSSNRDYLDIIHASGPSQFPALDGTLRRKLRKRVTFDNALHYSMAIS